MNKPLANYYHEARAQVKKLKTMQEENKKRAERRAEIIAPVVSTNSSSCCTRSCRVLQTTAAAFQAYCSVWTVLLFCRRAVSTAARVLYLCGLLTIMRYHSCPCCVMNAGITLLYWCHGVVPAGCRPAAEPVHQRHFLQAAARCRVSRHERGGREPGAMEWAAGQHD